MDTTIWGPKLWFFLHTMSFEYPDNPNKEIIDAHKEFLNSLSVVLPCKLCRNHYKIFLKNNPLDEGLKNKESLINWVLECHNNVNKLNNKPEWTYDMLIDKYTNIYKKSLYHYLTYKNSTILLSILLIILIIYVFSKK